MIMIKYIKYATNVVLVILKTIRRPWVQSFFENCEHCPSCGPWSNFEH